MKIKKNKNKLKWYLIGGCVLVFIITLIIIINKNSSVKQSESTSPKKEDKSPSSQVSSQASSQASSQTLSKVDLSELLKFKGLKFEKLGISLYTNDEVDLILNLNLFDLVQIPFNCLDNANLREESLLSLKSKNIETHTRSVFLQGLFFMERNRIEGKLEPLKQYLIKFDNIVNKYNIDKGALALQYALSKPYIDGVLIGVDSVQQIVQNISMLDLLLPLYVFDEIDKLFVNEINLLNPAIWNN
jgi:predicted aldo/keto reductase-like oxidoreductase